MGRSIRRVAVGVLWGAAAGVVLALLFWEYRTADELTGYQRLPRNSKYDIGSGLVVFLVAGGLVGGWTALWRPASAGTPVRRAARWVAVSLLVAALMWAGYCAFSPACRYAVYGLFNGEPRHDGLCRSFWVQELKSEKDFRRYQAANALHDMGPGAESATADLRPLLNDPDKGVRRAAAKALRHAPVGDPETIAALQPLLDDPDEGLRGKARETLFEFVLRDQREPLTAALDHPNYLVQRAAVSALGRMGRGALPLVPKLLLTVETSAPTEMVHALSAVGRAAPDEFTAHVRDYLRLTRPVPARQFGTAQGVMQNAGLPFVPLLIEMLSDPEATVRLNVAECLASMGAKAKDAKPALEKLSGDSSEPVRRMADHALHKIGTEEVTTRPDLTKSRPPLLFNDLKAQLQSDNPKVRAEACEWVNMWASGSSAVELLTPLLQDADESVRRAAQLALVPMMANSDPALALVIERLPLPEWGPTAYTASELGTLGPRARPAVPALVRLLDSNDSLTRRNAAVALWQIEGTDNEAVVRAVRSKGAGYLIGELAQLRPPPLRTIAAGLDSDDPAVRKDAARALAGFGPDAKEYVPTLLKQMPEDWSDRDAYAEQIDRIEPGAGTGAVSWMRWKRFLSEAVLIGLALAAAFLVVRWIAMTCLRALKPAPRRRNDTPNPFDGSGDAR